MIYLISGASRAGKSILTRKLAAKLRAGWFAIDALRESNNRLPEGERLQVLWPLLRGMISDYVYYGLPYIFDGGDLSVAEMAEAREEHKAQVRVCVLGFPDIDRDLKVEQIRSHSGASNDWLSDKSDQYVWSFVGKMIAESRRLRTACEKHDVRFVDTGNGEFASVLEEAARSLANE